MRCTDVLAGVCEITVRESWRQVSNEKGASEKGEGKEREGKGRVGRRRETGHLRETLPHNGTISRRDHWLGAVGVGVDQADLQTQVAPATKVNVRIFACIAAHNE